MNIRLKNNVIEYIKYLSLNIFKSKDVWIFGSRVQMDKKGGDIDIYIETHNKENILLSKIKFLREFDKEFGEQKVDLVINNFANSKPIFDVAKSQGVKI